MRKVILIITTFVTLISCLIAANGPFPEKYLFIINLWNYENDRVGEFGNLESLNPFPFSDKKFLENLFQVPSENCTLLEARNRDEVIDKYWIEAELKKFFDKIEPGKADVFIYYSGHGYEIEVQRNKKVRCLFPENTQLIEGRYQNYFSEEEFYDIIQQIKREKPEIKLFLFLDACYQKLNVDKGPGSYLIWNPRSIEEIKTWERSSDFLMVAGYDIVLEKNSLFQLLNSSEKTLLKSENLKVADIKNIFKNKITINSEMENYPIRSSEGYLEIEMPAGFNTVTIGSAQYPLKFADRIDIGKHHIQVRKEEAFRILYSKDIMINPQKNYYLHIDDFEYQPGIIEFIPQTDAKITPGSKIEVIIDREKILIDYMTEAHTFSLQLKPGSYRSILYENSILKKDLLISSNDRIPIPFTYKEGVIVPVDITVAQEDRFTLSEGMNMIKSVESDPYDFMTAYILTRNKISKIDKNGLIWNHFNTFTATNFFQNNDYLFLSDQYSLLAIDKESGILYKKLDIHLYPYQTPVVKADYILVAAEGGIKKITNNLDIVSFINCNSVHQIYESDNNKYILLEHDGLQDKVTMYNKIDGSKLERRFAGQVNHLIKQDDRLFFITTEGIHVMNSQLQRIEPDTQFENVNLYFKPLVWNNTINIFQNERWFSINDRSGIESRIKTIPKSALFNNFAQVDNFAFYLSTFKDQTILNIIDIAKNETTYILLNMDYKALSKIRDYLILYNDSRVDFYPLLKKSR